MNRRTSFLAGLLITGAVVLPSIADAHGIWFAQRARQIGLIYGVGAEDLDMVRRLPLIKNTVGYAADGSQVPVALRAAGPIVVVDAEQPVAIVAAWMDNGIWSKDPAGQWHKKGRDEVPDAIISERTVKFAVHLPGQTPVTLPMIPEHRLQIIPADPIPAMLGSALKIKVLFDGKPVANARITRDYVNDPDATPILTAPDGTATIDVRNQGLNVVAATFVGPTDQPVKYEKIEYLATLSFVLAHKPE